MDIMSRTKTRNEGRARGMCILTADTVFFRKGRGKGVVLSMDTYRQYLAYISLFIYLIFLPLPLSPSPPSSR